MKAFTLARRFWACSVVAVGLLAFGLCPDVRADFSQTYHLTVANPNLASQGSGSYATITITGVGSGITSTDTFSSWNVVASGDNNFVFGDHQILDFNIASGAGTVSSLGVVTYAPSGNSGAFSLAGSNQVDGFGNFSVTIDDGSGFSAPYTSFTLTFVTSNSVTLANLLTTTGRGAQIAAHMALSTNTACTGYAADGGTSDESTATDSHCTATPEPNSLVLLVASGLLGGLIVLGRRITI